ncbi:MAG: hypothetical protein IT259_16290 [Saprospiraceae bacterium]|nr:hypothetical protein [Saprospiraceae bacterium]
MQKVINTLLLLLMAFLLHACQDDAPPGDLFPVYLPGSTDNGEMSAIKSLTDWRASAHAVYHHFGQDYLAVEANTYSNDGYWRESISFSFIPVTEGVFPINRVNQMETNKAVRANYVTLAADGDVLEDYYILDTLAMDNYIQVSRLDTLNQEMEGLFTVSFILEPGFPKLNPLNPDRLKFSYGRFKVKITN